MSIRPSPSRLLAVLLAAFAAACSSPPTPKDTFYRLEVAEPARRFDRAPIPGVLEINRFDTDGVLSERALAYQEAGKGVQRYRYDFWSEPPGVMLQDKVAAYLAAAHAAQRIVTPDLRVPPDFALRGKLRRFEQIAGADRVAVEMQLALVSARDGSLVVMNTYSSQVPTDGEAPEAATAAMGRAVSDILGRFLADLSDATIPAPRR